MFLVFKQYYTYFYTLFYPHLFLKNTNNFTKRPIILHLLNINHNKDNFFYYLDYFCYYIYIYIFTIHSCMVIFQPNKKFSFNCTLNI